MFGLKVLRPPSAVPCHATCSKLYEKINWEQTGLEAKECSYVFSSTNSKAKTPRVRLKIQRIKHGEVNLHSVSDTIFPESYLLNVALFLLVPLLLTNTS